MILRSEAYIIILLYRYRVAPGGRTSRVDRVSAAAARGRREKLNLFTYCTRVYAAHEGEGRRRYTRSLALLRRVYSSSTSAVPYENYYYYYYHKNEQRCTQHNSRTLAMSLHLVYKICIQLVILLPERKRKKKKKKKTSTIFFSITTIEKSYLSVHVYSHTHALRTYTCIYAVLRIHHEWWWSSLLYSYIYLSFSSTRLKLYSCAIGQITTMTITYYISRIIHV